jgi:hypothetical protein
VSNQVQKPGRLTFIKKLKNRHYSTFECDPNGPGFKQFDGILRELLQKQKGPSSDVGNVRRGL